MRVLLLWAAVFILSVEVETAFLESSDTVTKGINNSSSSINVLSNTNSKMSINPSVKNDQEAVHNTLEPISNMQTKQLSLAIPGGAFQSLPFSSQLFSFDVETPVQTMLSFCSFTQSCRKENATKEPEIGNACCLPCDCSDRCYATGTCCVEMTKGSDHYYHQQPTVREESCVSTFIPGTEKKSQIFGYLLFQKCDDNVDYQTKIKCLHPNVSEVNEMIPVFSRKTNRHYRNIYCAKCYKDSINVIFWQTHLSCNSSELLSSGFPKLSSTFSISEFISTNPSCVILWKPPSNVKKVDSCFFGQHVVSVCNKPMLDILCKRYYAPVQLGDIIYKNVFCMECDNPSNLTGVYTKCRPQPSEIPYVPFTSLLSLDMGHMNALKSGTSEKDICPFPKIYSTVFVS